MKSFRTYVVYDLETIKPVPPADGGYVQGIEYCAGWGDYANMGISVLTAYSSRTNRIHVILNDNAQLFLDFIHSHEAIVSFNGDTFDSKVLKACWNLDVPPERSYDLYAEIRKAKINNKQGGIKYSLGLDALAKANGMPGKVEGGDLAPVLWQQGKWGRVIDYCCADTDKTHKLYLPLADGGTINSSVPTELIKIRSVDEVMNRKEFQGFKGQTVKLFDSSPVAYNVYVDPDIPF
jgi:hypothetical protein